MSEKKTISEIKKEYEDIMALSIMEFNAKKEKLGDFILKFNTDSRTSVISILDRAERQIDKINEENSRVKNLFYFEDKYYTKYKNICGVDEVGRGPFAGPIVTAAVILPEDYIIPYINDSKKVRPEMREKLYEIIIKDAVSVSVCSNSEKVIDEIGVGKADSDAMKRSVENLSVKADLVLVDAFKIPELNIKQIPIIKGDAKSASIAAASIVAKVTRDRYMEEMDKKYPGYGFAENKGYGSPKHIEALKKNGPCEIHRRSFIHNYV